MACQSAEAAVKILLAAMVRLPVFFMQTTVEFADDQIRQILIQLS